MIENLENEIWKDVVGFESTYQISNIGRVRAKRTVKKYLSLTGNEYNFVRKEKIKVQHLNPKGYPQIGLRGENKKDYTFTVHRLVAIAFLGEEKYPMVVNHIDHNPKNNKIKNLEWVTYARNTQHSFEDGNRDPVRGSRHGQSKVTELEVLEIREKYSNGIKSPEFSRQYGIGKTNVMDIVKRKIWKHI